MLLFYRDLHLRPELFQQRRGDVERQPPIDQVVDFGELGLIRERRPDEVRRRRGLSRRSLGEGGSSTIVHSRPVLAAKPDLASRCIRR